MRAQQAILRIVDDGILADIGKVTAYQCEVMITVGLTDLTDTFQGRLVADMTAEGVAGIRGINHHTAGTQHFDRLSDEAPLRRYRMQLQIDTHIRGYDTRMNQLLEWSPLIVFFVVFELLGIYWATASLMVTCVTLMSIHRLRTGRFKTLHVVTAGVVLLLGTATLLLHDKRFIQWKPTVLLGLTAVAFLGSNLIGRQPLARRMLERVFSEPLDLSRHSWVLVNSAWAAWFGVLAAANIYVAQNFAEGVWVKFKVFGITAAMLLFMIPQVIWLNGQTKSAQTKEPV
jgi:intracellular septation protein